MNSDQIRGIEELSLNAWPSPRQVLYDGWVLRFADGYTRRANSITPLSPGNVDVREKIRFCESMYARQKLPTVFKLTVASEPPGLDAALAGAGFSAAAGAIVQVADIQSFVEHTDPRIAETDLRQWTDALASFGYLANASHLAILRQIIGAIALPHCHLLVRENDTPLACGLGVLQGQWLGLFDIVTDPNSRRRGLGAAVIAALLQWGQTHGAAKAYLQVVAENEAALGLYARFGFHRAYEYEYWQRI